MTDSTGGTTARSTVSAAARRSTWAAASLRRPGSRRMLGAGCTVPGCARCLSCLRRGSPGAASMRSSSGCGSRATTVPTRTAEWRGSPWCATERRIGSAMTRVPSMECAAAPTTGRAGSRRRRRRLRRRHRRRPHRRRHRRRRLHRLRRHRRRRRRLLHPRRHPLHLRRHLPRRHRLRRRLRHRHRRRRRRHLRRHLPRLRRPLSSRTRSSRATNTAGTTAGRAKIGMPPSSTKSTAACAAGRHHSSAWAAASRMPHGCRRRPDAGSTAHGCARWPSCPRRGTRAAASTRRTCGCGSRAIMVPRSTTCPWERGSSTWPRTVWAAITPPSPVGSGSAKRPRRCERCAAAPTR